MKSKAFSKAQEPGCFAWSKKKGGGDFLEDEGYNVSA